MESHIPQAICYSLFRDKHWSSSSHLGDIDINFEDKDFKNVFLPLSTRHLSYSSLFSLVKPHPQNDDLVEVVLQYESKCPAWLIKAIVRDVIGILSEWHKLGIVYNYDLLISVLAPTKVLADRAQSNTSTESTCDLELFLFDHSFMTNQDSSGSYSNLKGRDY